MRACLGVLTITNLIFLTMPADATVLMHVSVKEMTRQATDVVQGKVVFQSVTAQGGTIWTDSHVKVTSTIKGKSRRGRVVLVRQMGGETATRGVRVAGVARFSVGEEVLVFLEPAGGRFYKPVGMCLGKYRLTRDSRGRRWASRDLTGAAVARFDARAKLVIRHTHGKGHWDLVPVRKLVGYVRGELKRGGAR